jgi:glutathione synthase/RimK-type ligase-like ATP-grasp enzyme
MILIISCNSEEYTNQVERELERENIPFYRFNLDLVSLKNTYLNNYINDIELCQNGRYLLLSKVIFVWIKRNGIQITHKEEKEYGGFSNDINFDLWKKEWANNVKYIFSFLEYKKVKWFDYPESLLKAGLKDFQIRLAQRIGFKVPKTLISNSKDKIIQFINSNKESIVKLSTQPAYFIDESISFIYTNKITINELHDFDNCVNSPMIFQEYIDKKYEVRYTFVNRKHFVCKIDSQISKISNIDWRRYDIKNTPYLKFDPPNYICRKVNRYMKCIDLNYGAIDFIVDNDNQWWFLEINSVGQYGWIEQLTGMPITDAIVNYIKSKIL